MELARPDSLLRILRREDELITECWIQESNIEIAQEHKASIENNPYDCSLKEEDLRYADDMILREKSKLDLLEGQLKVTRDELRNYIKHLFGDARVN